MKKKLLSSFFVFSALAANAFAVDEELYRKYRKVTKDPNLIQAVEKLEYTTGKFSKNAILGNNNSEKPIKIEFTNLANINPLYANFDALGWLERKGLCIYINEKHKDAPIEALSALLAHEAIHQDDENSINEETYAWTLEGAVWKQLTEDNPQLEKISHPLVKRENVIKQLFEKGGQTHKYIYKFVVSNQGYKNLPERSAGFETPRGGYGLPNLEKNENL